MKSVAGKSIQDVTLAELAEVARKAGREAAKRAAAAGLKVTTVESLWEDDAASAAHEVDAASAAKRA